MVEKERTYIERTPAKVKPSRKKTVLLIVLIILLVAAIVTTAVLTVMNVNKDDNNQPQKEEQQQNKDQSQQEETTEPQEPAVDEEKENILLLSVDSYDYKVKATTYVISGTAAVTQLDGVLKIDNKKIKDIPVDEEKVYWTAEVDLSMGENEFDITLSDDDGNKKTKTVSITRVPDGRAFANEYLALVAAYDDKALDYTKESTEGYYGTEEILEEKKNLRNSLLECISLPEEYDERTGEVVDSFIESAYAECIYKIISENSYDDEITVDFYILRPDEDSVISSFESIDMDELLEENFPDETFETEEEAGNAFFKLLELAFDKVLEDSSIYEKKYNTIQLELYDDELLVVNVE